MRDLLWGGRARVSDGVTSGLILHSAEDGWNRSGLYAPGCGRWTVGSPPLELGSGIINPLELLF